MLIRYHPQFNLEIKLKKMIINLINILNIKKFCFCKVQQLAVIRLDYYIALHAMSLFFLLIIVKYELPCYIQIFYFASFYTLVENGGVQI